MPAHSDSLLTATVSDEKIGFWGPPQTTPTVTGDLRAPNTRTRKPWGLIDVLWGCLGLLLGQIALLPVLSLLAIALYDIDLSAPNAGALITDSFARVLTTGPGIVIAMIFQWAAFVGTPWWVSRRKGHRSLRLDFGLSFRKSDLWWGAGLAWLLQGAMMGFTWLLHQTSLDLSGATNTGQVTDHTGLMLVVMIFAAAVGAPFTEEIFFRGLLLRGMLRGFARVDHAPVLDGVSDKFHHVPVSAARRRVGTVAAVLVSTVFFGMMHIQTSTNAAGQSQVLLGHWIVVIQTGLLGLAFALVALKTRRIGLNIVAHLVFNSTSLALVFLIG